MALNPIVFTEKVVRSFLRYQLTAYPFADERLHTQMRRLLSLDETRQSPLMKGPFISLSRPFREGASIDALVREGHFHPHMRQRIPPEITHVYGIRKTRSAPFMRDRRPLFPLGRVQVRRNVFSTRRLTTVRERSRPGSVASRPWSSTR